MEGDAEATSAIECSVAERERGCVAALPTDPVRRLYRSVGHGVRAWCCVCARLVSRLVPVCGGRRRQKKWTE